MNMQGQLKQAVIVRVTQTMTPENEPVKDVLGELNGYQFSVTIYGVNENVIVATQDGKIKQMHFSKVEKYVEDKAKEFLQ